MDAECRFEVGDLMEIMLEALSESMAVGSDKVCLHLCLADLPISETHKITYFSLNPNSNLKLISFSTVFKRMKDFRCTLLRSLFAKYVVYI